MTYCYHTYSRQHLHYRRRCDVPAQSQNIISSYQLSLSSQLMNWWIDELLTNNGSQEMPWCWCTSTEMQPLASMSSISTRTVPRVRSSTRRCRLWRMEGSCVWPVQVTLTRLFDICLDIIHLFILFFLIFWYFFVCYIVCLFVVHYFISFVSVCLSVRLWNGHPMFMWLYLLHYFATLLDAFNLSPPHPFNLSSAKNKK